MENVANATGRVRHGSPSERLALFFFIPPALDNRSRSSFTFVRPLNSLSFRTICDGRFIRQLDLGKPSKTESRGARKNLEGKEKSTAKIEEFDARARPNLCFGVFFCAVFKNIKGICENLSARFVASSIASNQIYRLSQKIYNFDRNIYHGQAMKPQCRWWIMQESWKSP